MFHIRYITLYIQNSGDIHDSQGVVIDQDYAGGFGSTDGTIFHEDYLR